MSAKKIVAKPTAKKSAANKAAVTHPTWADMIKECIAINTEDARIGVSRPQIKKYVETKYKLEIGAAQSTQLAKAITTGAEKGVFVLPKGPSGRVKLAPKSKPVDMSSKENKPASKISKPASKAKVPATKGKTTKAAPAPKSAARTMIVKKATGPTKPKAPAAKKPAPKKVLAGKSKAKAAPAKKTTTATKRAPAKKAVTGASTVAAKVKAAAKKAAVKRTAPKKEASKPSPAKVPRKSPTKRT